MKFFRTKFFHCKKLFVTSSGNKKHSVKGSKFSVKKCQFF
jgi:hypothetical protein